jgi:hypothetical protein
MIVAIKCPRDYLSDELRETADSIGYCVLSHYEDGWDDPKTILVGSLIDTENMNTDTKVWNTDQMIREWDIIEYKLGISGERVVAVGTMVT